MLSLLTKRSVTICIEIFARSRVYFKCEIFYGYCIKYFAFQLKHGSYCQYGMFRQVKVLKTGSKEVEGGKCMRGSDGKLWFSEKDRGKVWKDYMDRIMNEENDMDHDVEGYVVEDPGVCISREVVLQAKPPGPLQVSLE